MGDGKQHGSGSQTSGPSGRTNFEDRRLNDMLDLIDGASPGDLESVGRALSLARDGPKDASQELLAYVSGVDWKGESGDDFRRFGKALAGHADKLGVFADVAGQQIAGAGLASVRNSTPERDGRSVEKRPGEFTPVERVVGNADFEKAVKAEGNRQEAINQMNRLASFYAVSGEHLAGQEPPTFPGMLKADVPRPLGGDVRGSTPGAPVGGADPTGGSSVTASRSMPDHEGSSGAGGVSGSDVRAFAPVAGPEHIDGDRQRRSSAGSQRVARHCSKFDRGGPYERPASAHGERLHEGAAWRGFAVIECVGQVGRLRSRNSRTSERLRNQPLSRWARRGGWSSRAPGDHGWHGCYWTGRRNRGGKSGSRSSHHT